MANRIRKNDEVIVLAGKHKGQSGKVISVNNKKNEVVVDKLNIIKVHKKPTQTNPEGGIFEKEAPMDLSNVAYKTSGKNGKPSKIGFKVDDKGKKVRFVKRTKKEI